MSNKNCWRINVLCSTKSECRKLRPSPMYGRFLCIPVSGSFIVRLREIPFRHMPVALLSPHNYVLRCYLTSVSYTHLVECARQGMHNVLCTLFISEYHYGSSLLNQNCQGGWDVEAINWKKLTFDVKISCWPVLSNRWTSYFK